MARPLRIQFQRAFYHVMNRGLERRVIFKEKDDYRAFLRILINLWPRYKFIIHSYCLMPNHYHFLIETPRANLAQIMRGMNGLYTQTFNRRYNRVGPLFQGRYKALLIDKDAYALHLSRYIHLNPLKAKLTERLEDYEWSSFPIFLGKKEPKIFLETQWLLSQIGNPNAFRRFTLEGLKSSWDPIKEAKHQSILGKEIFLEKIKKERIPTKNDPTVSRLREFQKPTETKSLKEQIQALTSDSALSRKLLIYHLKRHTPLSLKEIGGTVGNLSPSAVCQVVSRLESEGKRNKQIYGLLAKTNQMSNVKT
jgi:putative transposase